MQKREFIKYGLSLGLSATSMLSFAQAKLVNQVKVLYGFPAGSAGDSVARRVAERLGNGIYTTKPGYVENRPGAAGRTAITTLKNSPLNGSVLGLFPVSSFTLDPLLENNLGYGPEDFRTLSIGARLVHGLAVGPAVPESVKNLEDFLAWCKANKDKANYGSPGAGSMPHMIGYLLAKITGTEMSHIPYRGTLPAVSDLVGGQVEAIFGPCGDFLQYVSTGKVRVLATSGSTRTPFLPDTPTFAELGEGELTTEEWFGFYAPAQMPDEIVALANKAITDALKMQEVKDALAVVGMLAAPTTPEQMLQEQNRIAEHWAPLVKKYGFTNRA